MFRSQFGQLVGVEDAARRRFTAVTAERAISGSLPTPSTRVMVAQAQSEGLTLITDDKRIAAYDVAVLW